jgi:DNA-directed RNA polymerase subunit RPC12/RpoP
MQGKYIYDRLPIKVKAKGDNMNSKNCPDCSSNDVQQIDKEYTVVNEKSGCAKTAAGCLFWPLALIIPKKVKTEKKVHTHYVCRGCGREFND